MKNPPEESADTSRELTQHILSLTDRIYRSLEPGIPHEGLSRWLSSDLTVAQLRVLLLLHTEGPMRMSAIATHLSIALSTATGILDKLVTKDMVIREDDPEDRRLVNCKLSKAGHKLSGGLWDVGRAQIERLLHGLTAKQLRQATEVVEFLYANVVSNNKTDALK
jgi:DNA-binding MarR family transcriptional regulator